MDGEWAWATGPVGICPASPRSFRFFFGLLPDLYGCHRVFSFSSRLSLEIFFLHSIVELWLFINSVFFNHNSHSFFNVHLVVALNCGSLCKAGLCDLLTLPHDS